LLKNEGRTVQEGKKQNRKARKAIENAANKIGVREGNRI